MCGVGSILSQKEGRNEQVITYANKMFSHVHKKFHPMERKCYAIVWDVMHFHQYLYHNRFTLKIDHKPLEWLVVVSNFMEEEAHGSTPCKIIIFK